MARQPSDYDEFAPKGAPGRRLPQSPQGPAARPAPEAAAAPPPVDPRAPFTAHQAASESLPGAPDRTPANRAPWVVLGTTGVVGATLVLMAALLVAEGWSPARPTPILAASAPRHITDAAYGGAIVDNVPPPNPGAAPQGPTPGPIKIFASANHSFVSIEVDCPSSGYQRRGRFFPEGPGKMAATVRNVPPGEKCRVTFQGTEAATTWALAHETRECVSFNPTVCPVR